ncbi:MAG TPA: hypothetical protein VMR81_06510 [Patescibacteria group bacterium]|nr:hypothetical protein [Patescibacteria group bacterium]
MTDTTLYSALATSILKGQLLVIGPLAVDQAKMVTGITVDSSNTIRITGNEKEVLTNLVKRFERLFGKASIEVCKEAIKESQLSISDKDLPDILK